MYSPRDVLLDSPFVKCTTGTCARPRTARSPPRSRRLIFPNAAGDGIGNPRSSKKPHHLPLGLQRRARTRRERSCRPNGPGARPDPAVGWRWWPWQLPPRRPAEAGSQRTRALPTTQRRHSGRRLCLATSPRGEARPGHRRHANSPQTPGSPTPSEAHTPGHDAAPNPGIPIQNHSRPDNRSVVSGSPVSPSHFAADRHSPSRTVKSARSCHIARL